MYSTQLRHSTGRASSCAGRCPTMISQGVPGQQVFKAQDLGWVHLDIMFD